MSLDVIGRPGRSSDRTRSALAIIMLLTIAGCASSPIPTEVPTAQSIAGLTPSGTVKLTEAFVGGAGIGRGVLTFRGKTYPFRLIGSVIGPGSLSKIDVSGDVFKLDDIAQFPGPTRRATGRSAWKPQARAICGCRTRPA
jgi:hypothetical protein